MANVLAIRSESSARRLNLSEIGGGKVIRQFSWGNRAVRVGEYLTAEQIASLPAANRTTLIGRFIDVWPKAAQVAGLASSSLGSGSAEAEPATRHVVALGFGRYNVVEGVQLNDEPLSRSDAWALAGRPEPPKRGEKEH